MHHSDTIKLVSQVRSEICELEKTIVYLKNRILRKQIMIDELMIGSDGGHENECPLPATTEETPLPVTTSLESLSHVPKKRVSLRCMIEDVLTGFNGDTFHFKEIRNRLDEKYPESRNKSRQNFYVSVATLIKDGKILRTPGGFTRNHTP